MTIYITKNGQRLGPYSVAETQRLLATGAVQPADLAWYEGLTTWIPLQQVPGVVAVAPPPPRAERPVLVWVICLFFFTCTPFSCLGVAMLPLMSSGTFPVQEAQKHYFESLTFVDYGSSLLNIILVLIWAILLFMLKRASLYVFIGTLALGVLMMIYNIVTKDWLNVVGIAGLIGAGIGWVFNLLLLYYNWHLFRKGVLR